MHTSYIKFLSPTKFEHKNCLIFFGTKKRDLLCLPTIMNHETDHIDLDPNNSYRELTQQQREEAVRELLFDFQHGRLKRGAITRVAKKFAVNHATISRLWKLASSHSDPNHINFFDVASKTHLRGRKVMYDIHTLKNEISQIPLSKRKTLRDVANTLSVLTSVVQKMKASGELKPHSSALRPMLTEENKINRYLYCCNEVRRNAIMNDMFDRVHVDKKWFYLTEDSAHFYLALGEKAPHRQTRSKRYVQKVMFLCAVARPRYDSHQNRMWDGKLGIWPFAELRPAKRASANRAAGTLEWKNFKVNTEAYRRMIVDNVLPAIAEKWPIGQRNKTIRIQQDNAPVHIGNEDEEFRLAVEAAGIDIKLYEQPPNSPDLNVLDLGYFRALQSLQYKRPSKDVAEMIATVQRTYADMPWRILNNNFLTLQTCMEEIIQIHGGNDYSICHMGKEQLEREGRLPVSIQVDDDIFAQTSQMNGWPTA